MELVGLFFLGVILFILCTSILSVINSKRLTKLQHEIDELRKQLFSLRSSLSNTQKPATPTVPEKPKPTDEKIIRPPINNAAVVPTVPAHQLPKDSPLVAVNNKSDTINPISVMLAQETVKEATPDAEEKPAALSTAKPADLPVVNPVAAPDTPPVETVTTQVSEPAAPLKIKVPPHQESHRIDTQTLENETQAKDAENIRVETIIGKRLLTWAGVGVFFLGMVFFLKYAYDQNWLGGIITPPVRVAFIGGAAIAMTMLGLHFMRRNWNALGHGLSGGGIALIYLAIYGSVKPELSIVHEPLFSMTTAFGLMSCVTATAITIAVRQQAMAMAVIAVLGGFATPIMLSTGGGSRELLFTYILILDLGVLVAAWFSRWHSLDLLAFVGTAIVYGGWFMTREIAPYPVVPLMTWLSIFHLIFLFIPFLFHWRHRTAVSVQRFTMVAGNLAFFMSYASYMLRIDNPMLLASTFFILASLYVGFGIFTKQRIPHDAKVVHSFYALGTMLVMLSLLYCLPNEAIATAWFVESVIVLFLGLRYQQRTIIYCALLVYVAAALRLIVKQIPEMSSADAFLFNGWLVSLLVAPVTLVAWAFLFRRTAEFTKAAAWSWWFAWAITMIIGTVEIYRVKDDWTIMPLGTAWCVWWLIGATTWFATALIKQSRDAMPLVVLPLFIAMGSGIIAYLQNYHPHWPVLNTRFILLFLTLLFCLAYLSLIRKAPTWMGKPFHTYALPFFISLLPLTITTLETLSWVEISYRNNHFNDLLILVSAWIGLAGLTMLAKKIIPQLHIKVAYVAPLVLGLVGSFFLYSYRLAEILPVFNLRFIVMLGVFLGFLWGRPLFPSSAWITSFIHLGITVLGMLECVSYCDLNFSGPEYAGWLLWSLTAVFVASSAVGFWRVMRGERLDAYAIATGFLSVSLVTSLVQYLISWPVNYPLINFRWGAVTGVLLLLVCVIRWSKAGRLNTFHDLTQVCGVIVSLFLFVAATCETITYCHSHILDESLAERVANFSVTALWSILGFIALLSGFFYRVRKLRLLALVVFGITAAKLLIYDMSGVNQLYRIAAFMLVGLILIAASYIYHRLERRLSDSKTTAGQNPQ
jgi:uncharacterized membrane protein